MTSFYGFIMQFRTLTEIKTLRKKYHLNQKELARQANVSQSLIAKVEAGKIDPSFTKAQQIFDALDYLREKEEVKARDIMRTKVFAAHGSESLKDVIKNMKSKGISQLPVMVKERVVGLISESDVLMHIADNPEKIHSLKVSDVMEEAPPIVSPQTGMMTLLELLKNHPVILVSERGEIKGIISKTDLLGKVE